MSKRATILLLSVVLCVPATAQGWSQERYDSLLASITAPSFRADTTWIAAPGSKGAIKALRNSTYTEIINTEIEKCSERGGGVVALPAGVYNTAGITLRSNVDLHLCEGATLKFSGDPQDYLPVVRTRWEGVDCMNYRPLIYACGQSNIAITGNGEIDGSASSENWWWMKGRKEFGYVKGMPSQGNTGRPLLMKYNDAGTPVGARIMGEGKNLRPQLINIIESENVLIQGVTLRNSPFWVVHPLLCRNFTMRGVTVCSFGPNNDGCDPESCNGVLIEDCTFFTGDDCIALKSGRNNDGRRCATPSRGVIIRRCHFAAGHGGITIGSEISGGFNGLYAEDCSFDGEDLQHVLRFKSSRVRGGEISNVNVRNFDVAVCSRSCINVDMQYEPKETSDKVYEPKVNGVNISGITVESCRSFLEIKGTGADGCISGFRVSGCRISSCEEQFVFDQAEPEELTDIVFE
ncbi:MAG: glycoside hydrolase family 28 protein [Bacteroidales bacterium]|nr:glycoside hydrolase family 28 protein [Candidatus Cryptobacteroides aphodequi]